MEEIESEQSRMFDYLHGLSEVLLEESPGRMHHYIVNGVTRVVNARAGILYLIDGDGGKAFAIGQTTSVAPILPPPAEIRGLETTEEAEKKYRFSIRIASQEITKGLLGEILKQNEVTVIDDLSAYYSENEVSEHFQKNVSLMAIPLLYAHKPIGVLAVTSHKNIPFASNDREIFACVTEQSSIAMGSAIFHAEAQKKRRLESDLARASEIQRILLPQTNPELSDYCFAAAYRPAHLLSGDYYDYVKIDEDHYGVAIADVSGKGVSAALIMAMCRSFLRSASQGHTTPAPVLHQVNNVIYPDLRGALFVSFAYLILERNANRITIANAGHEPPLIRRAKTGLVEVVELPGMAVGCDKGPIFQRDVQNHSLILDPGDILLLYTDGVIDAENRNQDNFGLDDLQESFRQAEGTTADEILNSIMKDLDSFTAGTRAIDDITLIAVEKR
jgi:phosphoserine phosphatase RsbU/P